MQAMDFENFQDEASKHANQAQAIALLIFTDQAYTKLSPVIMDNALWALTDTLERLSQLLEVPKELKLA
ncbi:hypothetical protein [Marinomonas sp. PE14-40]|uniref:hypothetical protein n=1 Tax=Marinomonas sp. PE14-40 TaxID=3060621 RepID=UPI003F668086